MVMKTMEMFLPLQRVLSIKYKINQPNLVRLVSPYPGVAVSWSPVLHVCHKIKEGMTNCKRNIKSTTSRTISNLFKAHHCKN